MDRGGGSWPRTRAHGVDHLGLGKARFRERTNLPPAAQSRICRVALVLQKPGRPSSQNSPAHSRKKTVWPCLAFAPVGLDYNHWGRWGQPARMFHEGGASGCALDVTSRRAAGGKGASATSIPVGRQHLHPAFGSPSLGRCRPRLDLDVALGYTRGRALAGRLAGGAQGGAGFGC